MLYIFFGPDNFSLQSRLREIKSEGDDPSSLEINTTHLDGRKLALAELANACNTLPFLGQKRLVIVEGLLERFDSKASKQPAWKEWQSLDTCVDQMPLSTVLVLVDGQVKPTNPLLKKLTSRATVQSFPLLKGKRTCEWIRARVAEQGAKISPRATDLLAEFSGDDLWVLSNEIDKLVLHAEGQVIQEQDVKHLTSYVREANIFATVDAVLERRADKAALLVHQLLSQGEAVPHIMFMIARQLRLIVRANDLASRGTGASEIASRLGLSPNYPMDKLLKQGTSYSPERLLQVFRKLVETDTAIKTGRYRDDFALDLLVAELCCQPR